MRIRHVLLCWGAFLTCTAWSASLHGGLVESTAQLDLQTRWDGFEPDFLPDWEGETTVVEAQPDLGFGLTGTTGTWGRYGTGTIMVYGGFSTYRWTVRRIGSSARAGTTADARFEIGGEEFTASAGDSRSSSGHNYAELAHYAEVLTSDGRTLANASAIAYQTASFREHSFSANGRFSAGALLADGVEDAMGEASGWSGFDATYRLEEDTRFSLALDLARIGDAGLAFTAVDDVTDELVFSFSPTLSAARRKIEISGLLESGQYRFALQGKADTWIDSTGGQDSGGLAMYDVSLDFEAEQRRLFYRGYPSLLSVSAEPDALYARLGVISSGTALVLTSQESSSAPEPGTVAMLLLGGLACLGMFRGGRILTRRSHV